MSALLMVAVLAAAPVESVAVSAVSEGPATMAEEPIIPFRTGRELHEAARESLRRWARAEDHQLELAAKDLMVIFRELEADSELALALREPLLGKVRGRLAELARRLEYQAAVKRRLARESRRDGVGAVDDRQPLAQFGGGFGGGLGGMGLQQGMGGGPLMGMGGQGQNDDHGEQLVDLIQTTIRPNTWERVGGPGSIYYWRPGRAIVVRQMGDVHDDIADVLQQLNRLGR